MLRTSLYLPTQLHQRLVQASRFENVSLSRLISTLLDGALAETEKGRRSQMYAELKKLKGAGKANVTDLSLTMNEVLYGEQGAWRGSDHAGDE